MSEIIRLTAELEESGLTDLLHFVVSAELAMAVDLGPADGANALAES